MFSKEDRWIFTPDFFMGHWSVAISECETDPIFKKITVNYEKNAYEKSVNFWELCEALQWEWCLYDVCSTRLYCYDLHLLPAVQKVQPASQARAVTSLNSFTCTRPVPAMCWCRNRLRYRNMTTETSFYTEKLWGKKTDSRRTLQ